MNLELFAYPGLNRRNINFLFLFEGCNHIIDNLQPRGGGKESLLKEVDFVKLVRQAAQYSIPSHHIRTSDVARSNKSDWSGLSGPPETSGT